MKKFTVLLIVSIILIVSSTFSVLANIENSIDLSKAQAFGAKVTETSDGTIIDSQTSEPYLTFKELNLKLSKTSNAIRITFSSNTMCSQLKLYYTTPEIPDFSQSHHIVANVSKDENIQNALFDGFPANVTDITGLRIAFSGGTSGRINVKSIVQTLSYKGDSNSIGSIDVCEISGDEIVIKGKIDREYFLSHKDSSLYLYELPATVNERMLSMRSDIYPHSEIPITENFEFTLPLYNEFYSRITSKFVVAANTNDIIPAKFITNPEALDTSNYTKQDKNLSNKGLVSDSSSIVKISNSSITAIPVSYNKLISIPTSELEYTFENQVYFFNKEYVEYLDKLILNYKKSGIDVYLILTSDYDGAVDSTTDGIICYPTDSNTDNSIRGFNTSNVLGLNYLKLITDFIGTRYSLNSDTIGGVCGFIVGMPINSHLENYNVGNKTVLEFSKEYATAFRVIYNILKSNCSSSDVFTYVGSDFYEVHSTTSLEKCNTYDFVEIFSDIISLSGEINYKIALDVAPVEDITALTPISDQNKNNNFPAVISIENVERFTEYVKKLRPENSNEIIILENPKEPINSGSDLLDAVYTYSYYKLNSEDFKNITGYIVSGDGYVSDIFKNIDSSESYAHTEKVKTLLPDGIYDSLIGKISDIRFKQNLDKSDILPQLPQNIRGSTEIFKWNDSVLKNLWTPSENSRDMFVSRDFLGKSNILSAVFTPSNNNGYFSITGSFEKGADFSLIPYLSFDLSVTDLPVSIENSDVLIIIRSDTSALHINGKVKNGEWNKIVADISYFAGIRNVKSIEIYVSSSEIDTNFEKCTVSVTPVSGHSSLYDSVSLERTLLEGKESPVLTTKSVNYNMVIILSGIIVLCLTIEIIRLLGRRHDVK